MKQTERRGLWRVKGGARRTEISGEGESGRRGDRIRRMQKGRKRKKNRGRGYERIWRREGKLRRRDTGLGWRGEWKSWLSHFVSLHHTSVLREWRRLKQARVYSVWFLGMTAFLKSEVWRVPQWHWRPAPPCWFPLLQRRQSSIYASILWPPPLL